MSLGLAGTLYQDVRQKGLADHALQWGSLACCTQYRLAYEKTVSHVPHGSTVLDWGCGNGHFSYFLNHNGFQTDSFSLENEPPLLATLTTSGSYRYTSGRRSEPVLLPYDSETFDAVFSIGVLEHVHELGGDQARSVREVARVLKPGGLFMVFHLPNEFSWVEFMCRTLNRWTGEKRHAHSRLYTERAVRNLLQGTSLQIQECGRYNFIPRNSMNHFPAMLAQRPWFCSAINASDDLLAKILPIACTNWYFIIRKTA